MPHIASVPQTERVDLCSCGNTRRGKVCAGCGRFTCWKHLYSARLTEWQQLQICLDCARLPFPQRPRLEGERGR